MEGTGELFLGIGELFLGIGELFLGIGTPWLVVLSRLLIDPSRFNIALCTKLPRPFEGLGVFRSASILP